MLARTPVTPTSDLEDLGTLYGGWTIPLTGLDPSWVCYCVGIGGDVSFDLELIGRFGVTVRAVDPVEDYIVDARQKAGKEPRFSAHRFAVTAADGPVRLQVTHDAGSRSVSAAGLYESQDFTEAPGRTLPSLMRELDDERVDLLKLDIEGAEYEVVPSLDLPALGVRVFCTQLHENGSVAQARSLIAHVERQGYRLVACRPTLKLAFLRTPPDST